MKNLIFLKVVSILTSALLILLILIIILLINIRLDQESKNYDKHLNKIIYKFRDLDKDTLSKSISFLYKDYEIYILSEDYKILSYSHDHINSDYPKFSKFDEKKISISKSSYKNNISFNISEKIDDLYFVVVVPYRDIGVPLSTFLKLIFIIILIGIFGSYLIYKIIFKNYIYLFEKISFNLSCMKNEKDLQIIQYTKNEEIDEQIYNINYKLRRISYKILKIKYEKEKLESILNNMDIGIIKIDKNLTIRAINRLSKNLFNININLINKNIIYLIQNKKLISAIELALREERSSSVDLDLLNISGKIVSVYIYFIKDDGFVNKKIEDIKIILLISDITESKKMDQMRREFVENASHELKTPITSISGFSQIIISGMVTDQEKIKSYLNKIKVQTDRMSNIIDDILTLYGLEKYNPNEIEQITEIDFSTVIYKAFDLLHVEIMTRNINFDVVSDVKMFGNLYDIEKLIKNLIENSIKYNVDSGFIKVIVFREGKRIILSIEDSGIGIPPKHQSRIFERFYRVDNGRSRDKGGTGLGLAIVKHVVLKYNGKISLKSEENRGTKIVIELDEMSN